MITMLNSWSFDLNSNKSFGTPDPSIPIPSHGHSDSRNRGNVNVFIPIVAEPDLSRSSYRRYHRTPVPAWTLGPSIIPWSLVLGPWTFPTPLVSGPWPLLATRPLVNIVKTVNSTENHVCNPLISRVCTLLHVNQTFFRDGSEAQFHLTSAATEKPSTLNQKL